MLLPYKTKDRVLKAARIWKIDYLKLVLHVLTLYIKEQITKMTDRTKTFKPISHSILPILPQKIKQFLNTLKTLSHTSVNRAIPDGFLRQWTSCMIRLLKDVDGYTAKTVQQTCPFLLIAFCSTFPLFSRMGLMHTPSCYLSKRSHCLWINSF